MTLVERIYKRRHQQTQVHRTTSESVPAGAVSPGSFYHFSRIQVVALSPLAQDLALRVACVPEQGSVKVVSLVLSSHQLFL